MGGRSEGRWEGGVREDGSEECICVVLQLTFTNRGYLRTLWIGRLNRSLSGNL